MFSYCVCGLSVASDIDLPGLSALPPPLAPAEVAIRRGAVPSALKEAGECGPNWQMAGNRVLMRIPGIARFLLRSGNEIVFEPEGATSDGIAIFIIGTVFGILLHQRGEIVLHASAVRVGDRAVLFCGRSGAGKSTMAAALEPRGYPLVCDDVCLLGASASDVPVVHSDGRGPTLWADAIGHLDLAARQGPAVRANFDKYHVEARETPAPPLPLGAIYALRETHPPLDDGIESPNVIDATLLIRQSAYHPRLVAAMRQKRHYFLAAASLSAKVGVYYLTRPRGLARLAADIGKLEGHWQTIGLGGARP